MKNEKLKFAVIISIFIFCLNGHASVTLLDKDDWKFLASGFIETDMFTDSSRSLTEVVGSTPVGRVGTFNGDNGRTQFSLRNSRFAFSVIAPTQNDWKSKGYLEYDLLGYDPTVSTTAPTNSESSYFTNPSLRLRLGYISAENNGWQVLVGQYWTLFGWNPTYVLTTASVAPVTGVLYERTPQILVIKTIKINETDKLQAGISVTRPAQRDSTLPGLDGGVRYSMGSRRSGFASANGDATAEPMSLALTGTFRNFTVPTPGGADGDKTSYSTAAFALDALIPLLASSDGKDVNHTLSLLGEFTAGSGYGDEFPSWTANLLQFSNAAGTTASFPNLDAGQGGFDSSGNFQFVKLQTFNLQAQYHFGGECPLFATAGYGQLLGLNVQNLGPVSSAGTVLYDKPEVYFVNLFHDLTKQIRVALEYDQFRTHYIDGMIVQDNRYQVSAWFRF